MSRTVAPLKAKFESKKRRLAITLDLSHGKINDKTNREQSAMPTASRSASRKLTWKRLFWCWSILRLDHWRMCLHERENEIRVVWLLLSSLAMEKRRNARARRLPHNQGGEWIMNWIFLQILRGSFSAVSTPTFASKYSLELAICWKALAEIYTMHSFAPFFNLKISAKNRQHFFAIE